MKRYWIYDSGGEQVGGPFDFEGAAAETVRILEAETDRDYEYR